MEVISNPKLHELKKNKIDEIRNSKSSEKVLHLFHCDYHGVKFNLRTSKLNFVNALREYLPASWQLDKNDDGIDVTLTDPDELGINLEEWSDEVSQDCYCYNSNQLAIQRDFAAEIYRNKVNLICSAQIGDGFYNFLRWFLSEKLMNMGKYVVHSSCVLGRDGEARLFLGHSGAGKTTITGLSSPRVVLGDDMNFISMHENNLYVEAGAIGGQFNSMIGYGKRVPVSSIYWLKQSLENKINKLEKTNGYSKLLASFANLHWSTLPQGKIDQLMEFTHVVTDKKAINELMFTKDHRAWELIDP